MPGIDGNGAVRPSVLSSDAAHEPSSQQLTTASFVPKSDTYMTGRDPKSNTYMTGRDPKSDTYMTGRDPRSDTYRTARDRGLDGKEPEYR